MSSNKNQNVFLSIIVIGRNEGDRLVRCLESVLKMDPFGKTGELIYVDSDSVDNSIINAKSFNAKILQVKPDPPSPSIPRNAGWREAHGKYILFLDGDSILDPAFINQALKQFENPKIAVVCGKITELYPDATIYHRIHAMNWNPSFGIVDSCGGNALMRRTILEEMGGFDEKLVCGEEPELCRRIREKGYQILKMEIPMIEHDLNMTSFKQYWLRSERTGYAYASVSRRHWTSNDPLWRRESLHNWIKGGLLLGITFSALSRWFFDDQFAPLVLVAAIFFLLTVWTFFQIRDKEQSLLTKVLYAIHSHFQHFPIFIGQVTYWWDCMKGSERHNFDYKKPNE